MKRFFVFALAGLASLIFVVGSAAVEEEPAACDVAEAICIECQGGEDCMEMAEWSEEDCAALVEAAIALAEEGLTRSCISCCSWVVIWAHASSAKVDSSVIPRGLFARTFCCEEFKALGLNPEVAWIPDNWYKASPFAREHYTSR